MYNADRALRRWHKLVVLQLLCYVYVAHPSRAMSQECSPFDVPLSFVVTEDTAAWRSIVSVLVDSNSWFGAMHDCPADLWDFRYNTRASTESGHTRGSWRQLQPTPETVSLLDCHDQPFGSLKYGDGRVTVQGIVMNSYMQVLDASGAVVGFSKAFAESEFYLYSLNSATIPVARALRSQRSTILSQWNVLLSPDALGGNVTLHPLLQDPRTVTAILVQNLFQNRGWDLCTHFLWWILPVSIAVSILCFCIVLLRAVRQRGGHAVWFSMFGGTGGPAASSETAMEFSGPITLQLNDNLHEDGVDEFADNGDAHRSERSRATDLHSEL